MADRYRARRIADRIEATPRLTLDDFAAIQNYVQSIPGRSLAGLLVERLAGRPVSGARARRCDRRRLSAWGAWDGTMSRESVAASIDEVTLHFLTRRVYGLALPDATMLDLYLGRATQPVTNSTNYVARAIPRLLRALRENDLVWLRGLAADPEVSATLTWDDALEASLDEGLRLLRRKLGPRMAGWRWERLHRITLCAPARRTRPAGAHLQSAADDHARRPRHDLHEAELPNSPLSAAGNSVSYRQLFDLGRPGPGRVILPAGQPGQPASPHYSDMIPSMARGAYAPLPFSARGGGGRRRRRTGLRSHRNSRARHGARGRQAAGHPVMLTGAPVRYESW